MDGKIRKLKEYMEDSDYTVAITGAGISYMYGMRRFKQLAGQNGWAAKLTKNYIKGHPDEIYSLFKDAFLEVTFDKGPGEVHYQLAELEKMGLIQGIVTQNLDYLHELAGSTNVAAFMGSFADNICIDCGHTSHDINIWKQDALPRCPECGGYMIPEYFARFGCDFAIGQKDSREFMEKAQDLIAQAELLIIIGTTGFHSDEYMAKLRPSTKMVQINPGRTIFDSEADLNIRMDAEKVLGEILREE